MEDTYTFFVVLGIIAAIVLQIIMIVKFFQMASDIRKLRNVAFEDYQEHHMPKWKSKDSPFSEVKLPRYTMEGDMVVFDDGKHGWIYREFGTFSFIDNDEQQVFCHTQAEAIRGLYHALSSKTDSKTDI